MNDMPVEQSINPPEVYLSQEGKKPLSAADKALEDRAVNNLRPEKRTVLPRLRIPKIFVPSVMAAIIACGYGNIERNADATQPPPIPPPAVSEYQRPTLSSELVSTTEVPSPPPTIEQQAPSPTPKPPETPTPAVSKAEGIPITELGLTEEVKSLRDEKRAIYSKLTDDIEAGVPKEKRYFVKIGEKGKYQDRALIFTEPYIEQDGEKVWVAMTRDGLKSFSAKDSFFPGMQSDYIETFIKEGLDDLKKGQNDFLPYEKATLSEKWRETVSGQ